MARLADIPELKSFLGVAQTDCQNDRAYGDLLDRVSAHVLDLLEQPATASSVSFQFVGRGCCEQNLPYRSVAEVTSVVAERSEFDDPDETLPLADYRLQAYAGGWLLLHRTAWECGRRYSATLTVGAANVPLPVRDGVIRIAADIVAKSRLDNVGRARLGLEQNQEPLFPASTASDGTIAFGSVIRIDISAEVEALLRPYKRSRSW